MQISWQGPFHYDTTEVEKQVKELNGVYLVLSKLKDRNEFGVKYVGKTETSRLKARLLEHLSDTEKNADLKNFLEDYASYVVFAYIEVEEDRKNIEHTFYHHYKPNFNQAEPEGKLIVINFPI